MTFKNVLISIVVYSIVYIFFEIVVFRSIFAVGDQLLFLIIEWILTGFIFQVSSIPIYASKQLAKILFRIKLGSYFIPMISIAIYFIVVFYPYNFQDISVEVAFNHLGMMSALIVFYILSIRPNEIKGVGDK